jgi:hypothetical protein
MNHGDIPSRGRGLALAACTFLIMATVLGLTSDETYRLLGRHFPVGQRAIASAAVVVESATPVIGRAQTFPMFLTIPFAVTRTQQIMVARLKQRAQFAQRVSQVRSRINTAPGLLASLALIGASQTGRH